MAIVSFFQIEQLSGEQDLPVLWYSIRIASVSAKNNRTARILSAEISNMELVSGFLIGLHTKCDFIMRKWNMRKIFNFL